VGRAILTLTPPQRRRRWRRTPAQWRLVGNGAAPSRRSSISSNRTFTSAIGHSSSSSDIRLLLPNRTSTAALFTGRWNVRPSITTLAAKFKTLGVMRAAA